MAATADFSADATTGTAPLVITFTNLSTEFEGTIFYIWEYDDGSGFVAFDDAGAENPVQTFANPGTYTIRLTVEDEVNLDDETKVDYITLTAESADCAGADRVYASGSGIIPVKIVAMGGIGRCLGKNSSFRLASDSSQYVQPLPMTCEDYLWATDQE